MSDSRYKHEKSTVSRARWGPLCGHHMSHFASQVNGAIRSFAIRIPGKHEGGGFQGMPWGKVRVLPSEGPQRLALEEAGG